ncbi:MAG: hypothetical protein JST67_09020 [Bacteroidetes bacterium]|nr:hypothetical protein [Bacteroidota bacterium]
MSDLIKIGKIVRLHGLNGALILSGNQLDSLKIKKEGFVFLDINGVPTPFFVSEQQAMGKKIKLLLEGVQTIEQAKKMIGKEVWSDENNIIRKKNTTVGIEGYLLIDEQRGAIGKVQELIVMPQQKLLSIVGEGKDFLLPYADAFVKKIDHTQKIIHYQAPDGLLDIN